MALPHPLRFFAFALATTCAASVAHAQPSELPPDIGFNLGEHETPRSAAMAGSLRALSNSAEALFLNPANLATARLYHIAGFARFSPGAKTQSYGAAAVDSILNQQRVAGGLAVNFISQDPSGLERRALDLRFGLSFPISDVFFIGAALRHLAVFQDGTPASAGLSASKAAGGLPGERIVSELTFDAGVSVRPIPQLAISAVGTNLTNTGSYLMPLAVGGGIGYGSEIFSIEVDGNFDLTSFDKVKARIGGGAEVLLGDHFPIRAGYRYEQVHDIQSLSVGTGYLAQEFSLDAALRVNVDGPSAMLIVAGLRYHLDGAGIVGTDTP